MCLQNAAQFTILEEKTPMEGSTMAYTDDWESLMNGVFGAGGKLKFGGAQPQPEKEETGDALLNLDTARRFAAPAHRYRCAAA